LTFFEAAAAAAYNSATFDFSIFNKDNYYYSLAANSAINAYSYFYNYLTASSY